jgi:hypothetical protein
MTAEHIPARSAGNTGPVGQISSSVEEREADALESWVDGFALPTLCETCNGNGSRWKFIDEYKAWRQCAIDGMQRHCEEHGRVKPAKFVPGELINLAIDYDRMPGRFARYVIGMFLATQRDEGLVVSSPQLFAAVTASEEVDPPGGCTISPARVFLALCNRRNVIQRNSAMLVSVGLSGTTKNGLIVPADSPSMTDYQVLVLTPFAFTLVVSGKPPQGCGVEMSRWTEMGHHDRVARDIRTIAVPIFNAALTPE